MNDLKKTKPFVHPKADVQSANIGEETKIWQFVIVLPDAVIGSNCNISAHVLVENKVKIGNNVTIKSGVQIWDGVSIENDVFIGPNVTFTNDLRPRSKQYPESFTATIVKTGASIGANSTILAGISIGRYALIGAGSVVTKDVPDFTLWFGNPATQKGFVTKSGIPLSLDLIAKSGVKYKMTQNGPEKDDPLS